jgi:peroxiredoxin
MIHKVFAFSLLFVLLQACYSVGVRPGNEAPDFVLKDITQKNYQLSKYKGKVVLVHFWTDFCKSCKAEFPKIQEFYEELKGNDFELLVVNVGQAESVSKSFQKEFKATFPMLVDKQGITKDIYRLEAYPTNYFINPEGKIIRKIIGWVDARQVAAIIRQHKVE